MLAITTELPPQFLGDLKILRMAPYLRSEQGRAMRAVPIG
jgi:hypothetical protein